MALDRFLDKNDSKQEVENELLITKDVSISSQGSKVSFTLHSKRALQEYEPYLFFAPTKTKVVTNEDDAQAFFKLSIDEGTEGVMVKNLNAHYKAGARTGAMTKLKEVKEELDLVITRAEYGTGKRAGFLSSFYVGVQSYDESGEVEYLEVGKVASGVKELEGEGPTLENLNNALSSYKISEEKGIVSFEPKVIIQIKYQEIQHSDKYSSGYALRFPRIVIIREDKQLEEINTIEDIEHFL